MTQQPGPNDPQPKRGRRFLGPRMRYALFLLAWVGLSVAAVNTYLTFKYHNEFVSRDQGWPGLRHHATIGYENTPNFEAQWDTYFCKIHELGFRIGKDDSTTEVVPGGILAIGGSFTFGDAVEHEQAFPAVAAEALGLPVYNYGVGSYSYASALLQLRDLGQRGVLDRLAPSVILLGAGNWLVHRSLSPLFPTNGLPFGYAYIGRQDGSLAVLPPPPLYAIDNFWELADRYYPPGSDLADGRMTAGRFASMFRHAPRVLAAKAAGKFRHRPGQSGIESEELYRFVIGEIDAVAQRYDAQLVVLWMPFFQLRLDDGLRRSLTPGHVLVNAAKAIVRQGLDRSEYVQRHPSALAHAAYGALVAEEIRKNSDRFDAN